MAYVYMLWLQAGVSNFFVGTKSIEFAQGKS